MENTSSLRWIVRGGGCADAPSSISADARREGSGDAGDAERRARALAPPGMSCCFMSCRTRHPWLSPDGVLSAWLLTSVGGHTRFVGLGRPFRPFCGGS